MTGYFPLDSNTTLVKVKYFDKYKINFPEDNSNTTLVKVKLLVFYALYCGLHYSNTTLVKVKLKNYVVNVIVAMIQIQHLLKLNIDNAELSKKWAIEFKYNTC